MIHKGADLFWRP